MNKRFWAAVLSAAVALTSSAVVPYDGIQTAVAAPASASAAAEVEDTSTDGRTTAGGYVYSVTGSEATITGYTGGTTKELSIPTKILYSRTNTTPSGSGDNAQQETITTEYSVTGIADEAFAGQLGIETVTMSGGIKDGKSFGIRTIGKRAFFGCQDLKTITIAATTTSIGDFAFADCVALNSITVSDGNQRYKVIGGALYHYSTETGTGGYTLEQYPLGSTDKEYKVPDEVAQTLTKIGEGAFWGSAGLETIDLPATVKAVGESAFAECRNLKTIGLPAGLTEIGADAFKGDSSLTQITIPDGVSTINSGTFQNCESLTTVNMADSLAMIGNRAFQGCKALTAFTVPAGVTMIGDQAFAQCTALREVTIPMKTTSIGSGVFSGTTATILCHNGSQAAIYAGNNGFSTERTYTVAFYTNSSFSAVLSSQEVVEGKDAVPPEVEERDGYRLSWSGSYTSIRQDTRVYEVWKKLFDVTFIDNYNGNTEVVKTEDGALAQPPAWSMSGYTLSWDTDLADAVTNNMTIRAVWTDSATGKVIGPNTKKPPKKGTELSKGNNRYKVNSTNAQNPTVKFIGLVNADVKTVDIPEVVSIGGISYKVTAISAKAVFENKNITTLTINKNVASISAKAFYNCEKLKKVKIKTKLITNMNDKAFGKIHSKAVFYTYESQKSRYKTMLKNAGVKKPQLKRL